MATKPKIVTLTNSSVDILNAIRNNASVNYQNYVPVATSDAESIKKIGTIIMDFPALQNEFLSALVNRIGRVILTSKLYENPWAMFKKGMLDFGETVEEIFVDIAKPFQYDPAVAENEVFKREIPNVRSAFHVMNYQKFYKATIQQEQLRQAFLSWDGVNDLISKIVDAMYTGANYDEFLTMKYMLAKHIINGMIRPHEINASNAKSIVTSVKALSNKLTFLNRENNFAGVANHTIKDDQYVLVNSNFEATMNVEVLASAFNMDKAQFAGHMVLVDSFGALDNARLAELFADDPTYEALTSAELAALDAVPLVVVDRDFFMIFDNLMQFTEQYNGEGLYWNYWYHAWKIFSISPFAQAASFVPGAPSITSVTVTPATATYAAGFTGTIALSVDVVTANFAPQTVNWELGELPTGMEATINAAGVISITKNTAAGGSTLTATATSTVDGTKSDSCTITFGSAG